MAWSGYRSGAFERRGDVSRGRGRGRAGAPAEHPDAHGGLTAVQLAVATPEMQKNMLGERLLPLVSRALEGDRALAAKVTGMLLEMDNSELLVFLGSDQQLRSKVDEAAELLRQDLEAARLEEEADAAWRPQQAASRGPAAWPAAPAQPPALSRRGATGDLDGAEGVREALSLPCALVAQATLEGRRLVEARAWRVPFGWYALHAGTRPLPPELQGALQACWPDHPPAEALLGGVLGGLAFVEEELLPEGCEDVWARGDICHVVSKVIPLARPVRCGGAGGLWPLPAEAREAVLEQLPDLAITYFDTSHLGTRSR